MESVMGGRGSIVLSSVDEQQRRQSLAVIDLLTDLQRESAQQTLFTMAALEFYEEKLLRTLRQGCPSTLEDAVVGY
jgi:hypothetical protein